WAAALVLALRVLIGLGSGPLGVPLASVDALAAWIDRTPPGTMALALLRLAALVGACYLTVCTVLILAVVAARRPRMAAGALRLTPAVVRRLVSGGGGLGLAAGALLGGGPSPVAAVPAVPAVPVTASVLSDDPLPATTATMTRVDTSGDGRTSATATMTRVRPGVARGVEAVPAASPRAPASAGPPSASPATWVVEPGDSFWVIAAATLSTPEDRRPTDREIEGRWRRLMAANHDRLIDKDNPDLLVPGQELVLPSPD
ncbi:MAG: LysM peptidoglycan-binding domain-containing protein, partial [Acidimicrobiales bacterium]